MALAPYPWLEDAARTLAEMRVRLPNAVLIYGPPGIGLYELAFAFAQSLLCENPKPDGEACGECSACALMKAGTHPDCRQVLSEFMCAEHEVPYVAAENERPDAKKRLSREIRIHQIRALADFLGMNANRGGRRVVVVYPADAIRADAAATFLKNLEEPPERTTFLLVADDIDRVLPTIRSRCRLLRAKAPSHEEALNWLKEQGVDDAQEALARAAERPCLVTDEEKIRDNPDIDTKTKEQLLTLTTMDPSIRRSLLRTLSLGSDIDLTKIAVKEGRTALPVSAVLPVLERWSYDLLAVKEGLKPHYFPAYAAQMARLVSHVDAEKLFKFNDALKSMKRVVTHPLNAQLIIEQAILRYRKTMANQSFD